MRGARMKSAIRTDIERDPGHADPGAAAGRGAATLARATLADPFGPSLRCSKPCQTLRVAIAGEIREARRAGANTAARPMIQTISTPPGR